MHLIKYSENYEEFDENSAGSCKDLVIALISSNFLSVTDKYAIKYRIATMSLQKIAAEDLEQLLGDENVDFVLNVPKEPYITQSALEFANEKKLADVEKKLRKIVSSAGRKVKSIQAIKAGSYAPEVWRYVFDIKLI